MRRRTSAFAAFTLIELMVVLAIIAIMATIAFSTSVGNRPKTRLVAATSNARLEFIKARTAAVRIGRNHKVCFFRQNATVPAVNVGQMIVFSCNSAGLAGCPGSTVCSGNAGTPAFGTVDTAPCVSELNGGTANRWCRETSMGFDLASAAGTEDFGKVTLAHFLNSANNLGSPLGSNVLELTFLPSGFIDTGRSTAGYTSGNIVFGNHELCSGGCATSLTQFTHLNRVKYTSGGVARVD